MEESTWTVRTIKPPPILDANAAADFKNEFMRQLDWRKRLIVVDMSEVTQLDALPLMVVVAAAKRASTSGSRVAVAGLAGQPRAFFEEWSPDSPVELYATVEAAVHQPVPA